MTTLADLAVTEVTLRQEQFRAQALLNVHDLARPGDHIKLMKHCTGSLLLSIGRHVWAEDAGTKTVTLPLTRWESFKRRRFPAWLLRRFPVVPRTVTFDAVFVYPDFKPGLPERGVMHMRIVTPPVGYDF